MVNLRAIIKGIGSALEIFPHTETFSAKETLQRVNPAYQSNLTPAQQDAAAIAADWRAIVFYRT